MTLRRPLAVFIFLAAACSPSPRSALDPPTGYWRGTAIAGDAPLPLSIALTQVGDSLRATLSSPDLLILDQPLASVAYEPPRLRFHAEEGGERISFEGTVRSDTLDGTIHLALPGGGENATPRITFTLIRSTPPTRPYRTEELNFGSGTVRLSGTLYLPAAPGPHPAVVLLHGSSLNRRDAYRFYADHFARAGVAALIFDKRGSGASTGDYRRATLDELTADATAAVHLLARRSDVDPARIGLWGLSHGATLAPRVAPHAPIDFIIAVSGPGVSLGETAAYQDSIRVLRRGFSPGEAAQAAATHRRLTEWIRTGERESEMAKLLERLADAPWRRHTGIPRALPSHDERRSWYWAGRPLDPTEWWRRVNVPALILFGEDDDLLPARQSATRIERALREGGNGDVRVVVFPGGDHMIKHALRLDGRRDRQRWRWPRQVTGYMDTMTGWLLPHLGTAAER